MLENAAPANAHAVANFLSLFVFSFAFGALCWWWPNKVRNFTQKHNDQLHAYFATPEIHRKFIRACGFMMLNLSAVSLAAAVIYSP